MAAEFTFSADDIASGNKLDPGWHSFMVKDVKSKPGKADPSGTTFVVTLVEEISKTPVIMYFTDKFMQGSIPYLCSFVPGGKLEPGVAYKIEDTIGARVKGYSAWDMEFNKNTIKDWANIDSNVGTR